MPQTPIEYQREKLQDILSAIDGVAKVYYQPPSKEKLVYPCILYSLNGYDTKYSNGLRYLTWPSYSLILVDRNPESMIQKSIMDLGSIEPSCCVRFDRFYTAENLNHWAYTLYFTQAIW